jgi:hypothetical protein
VAARKELEQEPPNRKRGKRRKDGSETKWIPGKIRRPW